MIYSITLKLDKTELLLLSLLLNNLKMEMINDNNEDAVKLIDKIFNSIERSTQKG